MKIPPRCPSSRSRIGERTRPRVASASRSGSCRTRDAYAPQIIVGTHALLYEGSEFSDLGLIVIDEQHKFGVLQRTGLIARGDCPDVLVMTATPIPRTLTQTIYGDLDVSILREKPANRGAIATVVRDTAKLPEVIEFVKSRSPGTPSLRRLSIG